MTDVQEHSQISEPAHSSIYSRLRSAGSFVLQKLQSSRGIIIGGALVLGIATAHLWVPAWWQSVRDVLFTAEGQIIVGSPAVYTRQRLVNDRLAQTSWLQDQMKITERDQPFRGIDEVRVDARSSGASVALSVGPKSDGGDGGGTPAAPPESAAKPDKQEAARVTLAPVEPTTSDLFRMKNTYREAVRAEIMETQLDDRHDINGNTIYRLSFDATVLPGSKTDALAIVKVTMSHDPKKLKYEYKELYYDWMRRMQSNVDDSIEVIAKQLSNREPDLRIKLTLMEFVLRGICERSLTSAEHANRRQLCNPYQGQGSETPNMTAARKMLGDFSVQYRKFRSAGIVQEVVKDLSVLEEARGVPPETLMREATRLRDACSGRAGPVDALLGGKKVSTQCPRSDPPFEGLNGAVILHEKLRVHSPASVTKAFDSAASCASDSDCPWEDLTLAEYRCFAADYMKASLETFGHAVEMDRKPISAFFDTRIVGRDVGSCNLLFTAKWDPRGVDAPGNLAGELNSGVELYSYAVTPKNLVQHVATASDTRDAVQALLNTNFNIYGQQPSALADTFRKRSSQSQRIQSNPIVVGFGIGRQSYSPTKGSDERSGWSMQFGWAIAPQFQADDISPRKHSERQYSLAALISVPAWWRSVEVKVETCWVERSDLKVKDSSEVCARRGHGSNVQELDVIRLPGAINELSHKLGFEVVQEPRIDWKSPPQTPLQIETGRPAAVLLTGGRIWRSTEVTLGAQKADEIVVLPNMQGILAKFRCVRRQLPTRAGDSESSPEEINRVPVDIKVWTSEGVSGPAYAELVTRKPEASPPGIAPRNAFDQRGLCQDEYKDLGMATAPSPVPSPVPVPAPAPAP